MLDQRSFTARAGKPVLTGIGVALFVYLFAVPIALWRPPSVRAGLPASWPVNQDLTFTVRLNALHGNFDVVSIRFYVDHYGSTAKGPEGLFYPSVVFEQPPRAVRSFLSASHLTYPQSMDFKVTVPFREFAEQGLLGPGTLAGKVDVNYVSYEPSAAKKFPGENRMRPGMKSVPFSIAIQP